MAKRGFLKKTVLGGMLVCLSAFSDPLSGVVFGVTYTEIEILVNQGNMPTVGMAVEVFEPSDGAEKVLIGTWSVTRSEINTVFARPVEVSGTLQLGQKAIIGKLKPAVEVPAVSPVETVAFVAVAPVASKLPPKIPTEKTEPLSAAKYLYRGRYEDPTVMDKAAEVLQQQFNLKPRDALHVDGMAWICKALWASGEEKYLPALRVVESQTISPKLRKYAIKYRAALERKTSSGKGSRFGEMIQ